MTFLRNFWAVFLRELGAYFLSPVAYVVIFVFLLVNGITFYVFAKIFARDPRAITLVIESLFGFALFWILPLSPILTMRLLAEEKRLGTLELLMTAPVTETQVVLGKFAAAQAFYTLIWLSLLPLFCFLAVLGKPDWGPIASVYIGLFAFGLLTNSIGLFASALTRNQLVSAILALSGNLVLYSVYLVETLLPENPDVDRMLHYLSFTKHFGSEYSRGIVDVRYLFLYGSLAVFFLFFSVRAVEAGKWK
jgi:ABC-2 type transport system permease protein